MWLLSLFIISALPSTWDPALIIDVKALRAICWFHLARRLLPRHSQAGSLFYFHSKASPGCSNFHTALLKQRMFERFVPWTRIFWWRSSINTSGSLLGMCGAQKLWEILSLHMAGHETSSLKHQGPSAQHLQEHPEVILNEHTPNLPPARLCDAAAPQNLHMLN